VHGRQGLQHLFEVCLGTEAIGNLVRGSVGRLLAPARHCIGVVGHRVIIVLHPELRRHLRGNDIDISDGLAHQFTRAQSQQPQVNLLRQVPHILPVAKPAQKVTLQRFAILLRHGNRTVHGREVGLGVGMVLHYRYSCGRKGKRVLNIRPGKVPSSQRIGS
jgi:hypothetical protein